MNNWVKICLKTAWLTTAISILLMGTSLCIATDEACFQAGDSMMFLMFWLTFPCGAVFLIASEIFLDGGAIHFPSDFITAWMILMCGGLVQWFVLVPRLFEKRGFITLNLEEAVPSAAAVPDSTRTPTEITKAVPVSTEAPVVQFPVAAAPARSGKMKRRPGSARRVNKSFASFDNKGRTPLERVINRS